MQILIAEKDETVRALMSTRLQARHYDVLESGSSVEVMRILESGRPDLKSSYSKS